MVFSPSLALKDGSSGTMKWALADAVQAQRTVALERRTEQDVPPQVLAEHAGRAARTEIHQEAGTRLREVDEVVVPVAGNEENRPQVLAGDHEALGDIQGRHHGTAHGFHIEAPGIDRPEFVRDVEPREPAWVILVLGAAPDHQIQVAPREAGLLQRLARRLEAHDRGGISGVRDRFPFDAEFLGDDVLGHSRRKRQIRGRQIRFGHIDADTGQTHMHCHPPRNE